MIIPVIGRPGIQNGLSVIYNQVFKQPESVMYLPGGGIIAAGSLDNDNVPQTCLRAGLLMGQLTSSPRKWMPSILGVIQTAYTSGGTSITVTAAQAAGIAARVGTSGNLVFTGPPTSSGTVASITQAFSAINTSTGVITVTSLGANMIAGGLVGAADGTAVPVSVIPDGSGMLMPSLGEVPSSADIDFPLIAYRGLIQSANLINWPTNVPLQNWIISQMQANGVYFEFDSQTNT